MIVAHRPLASLGPEARWTAAARGTLAGFTITVPIVAWAVDLGVALTASHVVAMFVMVLAALVWVVIRRPFRVDFATFALACFAAVATVTVVRVLLGPDNVIFEESLHRKAVKQLVGLYFALAFFIALRYIADSFRLAPFLARAHFWTTAVVAAFTILQFFAALWDINSELANFPVYNTTLGETRRLGTGVLLYGFPRVSLTLVEPSRLGIYLLTGWALWLYARNREGEALSSGPLRLAAGILLGAAVLMTGSRAAHVVFMMVAAGAVLLRPQRLARLALVAASVALAATLTGPWKAARIAATLLPEDAPSAVAVAAPSRPREPVAGESDFHKRIDRMVEALEDRLIAVGAHSGISARHRIGSLVVALSVFRDYPLLGVGYGTSEFAMALRYPQKEMGPILGEGPHRPTMLGVHAVILAETGVIGGLCILVFVGSVCLALVRTIRRSDAPTRALGWGMAASLGGYAIAMTGQSIEVYQLLLVWPLLAIALTLDPAASRKNTPST